MAVASHSSRSETKSLSYSSAFASSTVASFASPVLMPATISSVRLRDRRSLPPSPPPSSSTVMLSMERRPPSPRTVTKRSNNAVPTVTEEEMKTPPTRCMCSPTSHAGSFRCAYHKRMAEQKEQQQERQLQEREKEQQRQKTASLSNRSLKLRRSALKNSLARIGCVEVDLVKRSLPIPVRSSSHQLRRREAFQPRPSPSRLSVMSKAQ